MTVALEPFKCEGGIKPGALLACRVCQAMARNLFSGIVLNRQVGYFECPRCGYLQTETPTWLDQAYEQAINASDTGILARNLKCRDVVICTLGLLGGMNGQLVDAAGGLGILVRLLRDAGVDAYWSDLYANNVLARGFEFDALRADSAPRCLVTSFESCEHFVEPLEELRRMLQLAPNVLLSTELAPVPAPQPSNWWYYGDDHGQHIGFFRRQTLQWLAHQVGKQVVSDGQSFHLFSDHIISPGVWRKMLRHSALAARWYGRGLESRIWADHLQMKKT
jgi:hypothetical protein